jgi:hypothetical protein
VCNRRSRLPRETERAITELSVTFRNMRFCRPEFPPLVRHFLC